MLMSKFVDLLFEMAQVHPKESGLNYPVYISEKNAKHGPRVKIFKHNGKSGPTFSITVSDNPQVIGNSFVNKRELKRMINWVILNKQTLIDLWNAELTHREALNKIKSIK